MALRNAFANLATEPKQDTANTHLATIAGQTPLTNTQLRATALPISGSVSVTGNVTVTNGLDVDILTMPAITGSVSVTNFPATQPVSGTVTVGNASLAVTGTFFQATQPVSIASMPTTPVTGTFFQATQPVSGTVTVGNASLAVTGTFFQATQPVSGPLTDTQLRATAVPVSGTFFQATQPVSGTVTVGNASIAVTGTFFQATQPISGSVTQIGNGAVSTVNSTTTNLAANAVFTGTSEDLSEYSQVKVSVFSSHASATNGLQIQQSTDGTNWDFVDSYTIPAATGKTFGTSVQARFFRIVYTNGTTLTTSLRIQTIYTKTVKRSSAVRPQDARGNDNDFEETLGYGMYYDGLTDQWSRVRGSAKGVQPTAALGVQDLKDAGRVIFSAATTIAGVTAVTAEALLTMVPTRDGVAAATATTQTVTSGKRLRITGINVGFISTAAAVLSMRFALRMNPAGAVTATSPILRILAVPSGAALAQAGGSLGIEIPDGIEFSGTQQFGITQIGSVATGTVWVSISGFEY